MRSVKLLSAFVVAGTGLVSAASTCTKDIVISDPTPSIDCEVIDADVLVDSSVSGSLSIEGPKQLRKSLTISNATKLISVSSSSINSIEGTFKLEGLELLSSLNMKSLKSVNVLVLINLPQLSSFTFGTTGVTMAKDITITDTFLGNLNGLNIATAETMIVTNNGKLTTFDSDLVNITKRLTVADNGNSMQIKMTRLKRAGDMQFRQVKSFDAPVLEEVESLKFNDSPELLTVSANNMTNINASLTFINNDKLANVSFASLKTIKGDITIQNNTALDAIDGFNKLETVGSVNVRGNFNQVKLPSLNDVKGSVTVTSTTDISGFCKFFDDAKKSGNIQGKESCTSNNAKANEGGNSSGQSSSSSSSKDAAGSVSVDSLILGLAVLAGVARLL